jgi:uncharacterized protein YjaG (DUF416 family)
VEKLPSEVKSGAPRVADKLFQFLGKKFYYSRIINVLWYNFSIKKTPFNADSAAEQQPFSPTESFSAGELFTSWKNIRSIACKALSKVIHTSKAGRILTLRGPAPKN